MSNPEKSPLTIDIDVVQKEDPTHGLYLEYIAKVFDPNREVSRSAQVLKIACREAFAPGRVRIDTSLPMNPTQVNPNLSIRRDLDESTEDEVEHELVLNLPELDIPDDQEVEIRLHNGEIIKKVQGGKELAKFWHLLANVS